MNSTFPNKANKTLDRQGYLYNKRLGTTLYICISEPTGHNTYLIFKIILPTMKY